MSILAALGASPSSFTTPTIMAVVAGSIGAAGAAGALDAAGCCSALSFLPHPARRTSPNKAAELQTAIEVFVFMFSPYLSCLEILKFEPVEKLFRHTMTSIA